MQTIKFSALSLCFLIAGGLSFNAQAASKNCNPVRTSNGITTFGNTGIKKISYEAGMDWTEGMTTMRNFCEKNCADYPETRIWRIPSRADMEIIGKCLDPKIKYWTSEMTFTKKNSSGRPYMAIAYNNGVFFEESRAVGGVGWAAIGITGGSSSEHSKFTELADAAIAEHEYFARQTGYPIDTDRTIKFYSNLLRTEMGAEAARAQQIAQQAQLLGAQPKGTIWNCMSRVVPVNMSINRTGFTCPNGALMDTTLMQKYRWKITSTERIPAQAENYRSDAFGMSNWNGSGVVISLMLEKQ